MRPKKKAKKIAKKIRIKGSKRIEFDMTIDQNQPRQVKLFSTLLQKHIFGVDFVCLTHDIISKFFRKYISDKEIKASTSYTQPQLKSWERAHVILHYFFNFKNSKNRRILTRKEINHIETDGYSLSIGFTNKGTKENL
jgi:hypothetical protein